MPKNKAAQALGKLGGRAAAAKGTTDEQRAARKLNAKKAIAARTGQRKCPCGSFFKPLNDEHLHCPACETRLTQELDEALRDPHEGDDTDLHLPWTY